MQSSHSIVLLSKPKYSSKVSTLLQCLICFVANHQLVYLHHTPDTPLSIKICTASINLVVTGLRKYNLHEMTMAGVAFVPKC